MEQQTENKCVLTKDNNEEKRVRITTQEAIEYREYKRQKKRAEILSAIANSEGVLSVIRQAVLSFSSATLSISAVLTLAGTVKFLPDRKAETSLKKAAHSRAG